MTSLSHDKNIKIDVARSISQRRVNADGRFPLMKFKKICTLSRSLYIRISFGSGACEEQRKLVVALSEPFLALAVARGPSMALHSVRLWKGELGVPSAGSTLAGFLARKPGICQKNDLSSVYVPIDSYPGVQY